MRARMQRIQEKIRNRIQEKIRNRIQEKIMDRKEEIYQALLVVNIIIIVWLLIGFDEEVVRLITK